MRTSAVVQSTIPVGAFGDGTVSARAKPGDSMRRQLMDIRQVAVLIADISFRPKPQVPRGSGAIKAAMESVIPGSQPEFHDGGRDFGYAGVRRGTRAMAGANGRTYYPWTGHKSTMES